MKHVIHDSMMKIYKRALDHSAKTDAKIEEKKPELMKQAAETLDGLLEPLFK